MLQIPPGEAVLRLAASAWWNPAPLERTLRSDPRLMQTRLPLAIPIRSAAWWADSARVNGPIHGRNKENRHDLGCCQAKGLLCSPTSGTQQLQQRQVRTAALPASSNSIPQFDPLELESPVGTHPPQPKGPEASCPCWRVESTDQGEQFRRRVKQQGRRIVFAQAEAGPRQVRPTSASGAPVLFDQAGCQGRLLVAQLSRKSAQRIKLQSGRMVTCFKWNTAAKNLFRRRVLQFWGACRCDRGRQLTGDQSNNSGAKMPACPVPDLIPA